MGGAVIRAGGFIRLSSLLFIWILCSPARSPQRLFALARDLRFDSEKTTLVAQDFKDLAFLYSSFGSGSRSRSTAEKPSKPSPLQAPFSAPAPAPAPMTLISHKKRHLPRSPNGIKTTNIKSTSGKYKLKCAKTVGYFFAGIAILLQVAVIVFLLIKRKQMIGVVIKYDDAPLPPPPLPPPPPLSGSQGRRNGHYAPT